jgi:transcriptional regulator with XRE-family HTH domain
MSTPLGDFIRAKRDSIQPESLGLTDRGPRRAPGLRRSDLAMRAGISVEYLTRIEQGRDRNPSPAVVNALADALSLDAAEREHLRYLTKISGSLCVSHRDRAPAPPNRRVRAGVLEMLRLLEPAAAYVTNRLGDVLAYTSGFELLMADSGVLVAAQPNLTRYVFTDPRARDFFADWDQVADELAFDLWLAPSVESSEHFRTQLAPAAGPEFARRRDRHVPPPQLPLRLNHPASHQLRLQRERLELPHADAQQLVVMLPADEATANAVERLRRSTGGTLRAVS